MTLIRRITAAAALILMTAGAAAQSTNTTATTGTAATPASTAQVMATESDSRETREKLSQVLDKFPPEVAKVLKLDPSLWTNQSYLASYPQLAAFAAAHPEVGHNPRYYFENVWIPSDPTPETESVRVWREMMEGVAIFTIMMVITSTIIWLIKTLVNYRRWSRVARVQYEVQNKLLDRMTSNDDLLSYVQSPGVQRFLDAAAGPREVGERPVSAPIGRILWSVQAGIVLGVGGLGLRLISANIHKDVAEPMFAASVLAMAIGLGFILSAVVSYFLSRRLGLWEPVPALAPPANPSAGE